MKSYRRVARVARMLVLVCLPGANAFAASPPIPTLQMENQSSYQCQKPGFSAVALGRSSNGDFHVGWYCSIATIWNTATGATRLVDMDEGKQIRAAGQYMMTECDQNLRPPWIHDLDVGSDVAFANTVEMSAVNNMAGMAYWVESPLSEPWFAFPPYSSPTLHGPPAKEFEKLGLTSFMGQRDGRISYGARVTALITTGGDVHVDLSAASGTFPRTLTLPGPATQVDIYGDVVVYVKDGLIYWRSYWGDIYGNYADGLIHTENLGCSSYHHPVLGGGSVAFQPFYGTPSYVIFEGRDRKSVV